MSIDNMNIRNYKVFPAVLHGIFHLSSLKSILRAAKIAFLEFFVHQFAVKWKLRKDIIIHVDHPLDEKVPFTPEKVDVYLDFVAFFIRPLRMLQKRCGKNGVKRTGEFAGLVGETYKKASEFYNLFLTTTHRPKKVNYKGFGLIHAFDPHYLCVPSLHIAIVILTYSYYRKVLPEEGFSPEEQALYNSELYSGALAIAETVLYIKQHSVNCIPAAVYMMTELVPSLFTVEDGTNFISALFVKSNEVSQEDCKKIREYIQDRFERLLLERQYCENWTEPLSRWLLEYHGQNS